MFSKLILTAAFGLLFISDSHAQKKSGENFQEIFSEDYIRAICFLKTEKWIADSIRSHYLNPKEVLAIAFPELIRYNSFRDKIETYALETLYVQYGKAYANFSIGEFQIKPSFAEKIEIDFIKIFGADLLLQEFQIQPTDSIQNEANRLKRVKRLKNKAMMVNYLCLYFKVMKKLYPDWKNEEEKIKFLSSAYNCGYHKSRKEIQSFSSKKFFHTGFAMTSTKYCYAAVALYFFQQPELFWE